MVFPFIFGSVPFEHLLFGVNFLLDPGGHLQQLSLDIQKRWKDPFKIG